jgi:hypothetical protein
MQKMENVGSGPFENDSSSFSGISFQPSSFAY